MTGADIILPASNTSVHPISQDIQDLIASCNFDSTDDEDEEQVTEATEPVVSDISTAQRQHPAIEQPSKQRGSRPMLRHRDSVRLMGGSLLPDEVIADLEDDDDDDEDNEDENNDIEETNVDNINDLPPISVIHVHDESKSKSDNNCTSTRSSAHSMRRKSCPGGSLEAAAAAAMRIMGDEGERRRSAEGPMPRRRSFGVPAVPNTTIIALKGLSYDEDDDDDDDASNGSRGGNSSETPSTAPTTVSEGQQGGGGDGQQKMVRRSSHKSAPLIGEYVARRRGSSGNISVSSRVSFDEEVKLERIDSFKHLLKKREKYATWYSDREMNSIQIEALVERLREKEKQEENENNKSSSSSQQKNNGSKRRSSMKKGNYSSVAPQQDNATTDDDDDDDNNNNDETKSKSSTGRSSRGGRFSLKKKAKSISNFFASHNNKQKNRHYG